MRQATALPHPGHLKRSLLLRFTADHGGLSIGTWLIQGSGKALQEAFDALQGGRLHFGDWEHLFLSAAIDHFRGAEYEVLVGERPS